MNRHDCINVLWAITLIASVSLLLLGRIPQDPTYHQFADTRGVFGIANFGNVVSNLPFLWVGGFGLWRSRYLQSARYKRDYQILCAGILLVAFGSAYYHAAPSTMTLLWDRLPMTIAFMALFAMLLQERVLTSHDLPLTVPLVVLGIGSALYWYWTETQGAGDLRAYVLVQFLPMLLIPTILWLFDSHYLQGRYLVMALLYYAGAKFFEHFDQAVFALIGISGHTIKHLLASVSAFYLIMAVPITPQPDEH